MTTKQAIYTGAINALGGRKALTTESAETTRVFDDHYDEVVAECLARGSWNFATEFAKLDGDTGLITYVDTGSVGRGLQYGFTKPSGWVRTHALSGDETFTYPLLHYADENEIIKAEWAGPIYMRYVSSDTGTGGDLTNWTPLFRRYVQLELAARTAYRLTTSASLEERIEKKRDMARMEALNQDAMDEPVKFRPPSPWTTARFGGMRGDRGSRSKLTG